ESAGVVEAPVAPVDSAAATGIASPAFIEAIATSTYHCCVQTFMMFPFLRVTRSPHAHQLFGLQNDFGSRRAIADQSAVLGRGNGEARVVGCKRLDLDVAVTVTGACLDELLVPVALC